MTMTENERAAIEEALKRPLAEAELIVVRDIDELPPSHLDVMEALHSRNGIAALFYLRAVTDDIDPSQLRRYVHGFDEVIAARRKSPVLRNELLYQNELGRPLTVDERRMAASLQLLSGAQVSVAKTLAQRDTGVALSYLHDLVRTASSYERQIFVETLAKS